MYVLCMSSPGWSMPFMFDPANGVLEQLGGCRCSHKGLPHLAPESPNTFLVTGGILCLDLLDTLHFQQNNLSCYKQFPLLRLPHWWKYLSFGHRAVKSVFHHLVVFFQIYLPIFLWWMFSLLDFLYKSGTFFFFFFLKCDLTVAGKPCLCPLGHSITVCWVPGDEGTSAWLESSFLWDALWFCPGWEVLIISVESGTLRNIRTSFQLEQT